MKNVKEMMKDRRFMKETENTLQDFGFIDKPEKTIKKKVLDFIKIAVIAIEVMIVILLSVRLIVNITANSTGSGTISCNLVAEKGSSHPAFLGYSFSKDLKSAVETSTICFIGVGTPQDEYGSADLKYVEQVAKSIGEAIENYTVIVDKSTVPVGTADKVTEIIKQETAHNFDVVSNPEFLKQGAAVDDFLKPDRVVIGSNSQKATEIMQEL